MADWLSTLEADAESAAEVATNTGYAYADRPLGTVRVKFQKHKGAHRYYANHLEFTRGGLLRLDRLVPAT